MSGTSMDGVDAVLADFTPSSGSARGRVLAKQFLAMPAGLKQRLMDLNSPSNKAEGGELHQASLASNELAVLYAECVEQLLESNSVDPDDILAIANHGQTVRHCPTAPAGSAHGYTVQLGNHALLAELTGLPVVADFRSRDVAAGGTGAPLVPAFHRAWFASAGRRRAGFGAPGASKSSMLVLNLGGIANVSHLRGGGDDGVDSVRGFDTGPANVLSDLWSSLQGRGPFDSDGSFARSGRVLPKLLERFLSDEYFTQSPPKSTGRDLFHRKWLDEAMKDAKAEGEKAEDVAATILELTAVSVARAIGTWCKEDAESTASSSHAASAPASAVTLAPVYVCGGGALNSHLLTRLRARLVGRTVASTTSFGLEPDIVEATAFAWLGWQFLQGKAGNLPQVTGAKGFRIIGAYYPA